MSIKIINAALQILQIEGEETLIVRGVVDPDSLANIQVDRYQREILSSAKINDLVKAIRTSSVPDIELGMRGDRHREMMDGREYLLLDDTYVIDGLQRITAAKSLMQTKPDSRPQLGCVVHFGTTFKWEKERFRILNQFRSKISPNILLRNKEGDSLSVDLLIKLCSDKSFVMEGRVCWEQRMQRKHLLTARMLFKLANIIHTRFGGLRTSGIDESVTGADRLLEKVGKITFKENLKDFFGLLDRCFNLKEIVFTVGAPQIKGTFICAIADVITRHDDFWTENRLRFDPDFVQKLAKFPLRDPEVMRLASAGGKAKEMLMMMIIGHINSGKRTRRLKLNPAFDEVGSDTEEADE